VISAIVLAAGRSIRMGQPKMILPWGKTTVIGKVVQTLVDASISNIYVVVGGYQKEVRAALRQHQVEYVINPDYKNGEMISSCKLGLITLVRMNTASDAALIVLGDQPQTDSSVIQLLLDRYFTEQVKIVVPSYQMHRGHPWLIDNSLWSDLLNLEPKYTLQDFLNQNNDKISYVEINSPSILQDLDNPDDYRKLKEL
jgi:molybdenum cofactor cytidylyltransferase